MIPSKVAGDFIGKNVIFLAYNVEDGIGAELFKEYKGVSIPTLVFIDGEGKEFMRSSGSNMLTVKSFIAEIEKALKPENSLMAREKRFKEDPAYAHEYILFLTENNMEEKTNAALNEVFERGDNKALFTPQWISYYNSYVYKANSPAVEFFLKHQKEMSEIMGKEQYSIFMKELSMRILNSAQYSIADGNFDLILGMVKKNPVMETGYSKFMAKNRDLVADKEKNSVQFLQAMEKGVKNIGTKSRERLLSMIDFFIYSDQSKYKNEAMKVYEAAISAEKDNIARQKYEHILTAAKKVKI